MNSTFNPLGADCFRKYDEYVSAFLDSKMVLVVEKCPHEW